MPKKSTSPLVYTDSDIYLDLITRNRDPHKDTGEERWRSAKAHFDAVNSGDIRLASSSLVEVEVCGNGESRTGKERVRRLLDGWFTASSTIWVEVDRSLAREAVKLLDEWQGKGDPGKRMGTADALHLAAAVRLEADYLMTHDGGFPHGHVVRGVHVLRPTVVWQETLLAEASGE